VNPFKPPPCSSGHSDCCGDELLCSHFDFALDDVPTYPIKVVQQSHINFKSVPSARNKVNPKLIQTSLTPPLLSWMLFVWVWDPADSDNNDERRLITGKTRKVKLASLNALNLTPNSCQNTILTIYIP